ncbi:MAG: IclR family transcriptional regulator [Beijerinckiaceae bacterium]
MDRNPINKALRALQWLIETRSNSVGVRELASALSVSPSGAHRLLSILVEEGMVRHDATSARYSVGVELYRLANIAAARAPIRQVALKHMRKLVDACNETALLGIYDRGRQDMIFAASIESTHPLRYAIELNHWLPVHTGASGLAIMAFLTASEVASIIERTRLAPATSLSITESYRLELQLQKIREQGCALTRGQRIPGAVGLAAPIFSSDGEVVGDVCLTIPDQRFDPASEAKLLDLLMNCTSCITEEIGGKQLMKSAAE